MNWFIGAALVALLVWASWFFRKEHKQYKQHVRRLKRNLKENLKESTASLQSTVRSEREKFWARKYTLAEAYSTLNELKLELERVEKIDGFFEGAAWLGELMKAADVTRSPQELKRM